MGLTEESLIITTIMKRWGIACQEEEISPKKKVYYLLQSSRESTRRMEIRNGSLQEGAFLCKQ